MSYNSPVPYEPVVLYMGWFLPPAIGSMLYILHLGKKRPPIMFAFIAAWFISSIGFSILYTNNEGFVGSIGPLIMWMCGLLMSSSGMANSMQPDAYFSTEIMHLIAGGLLIAAGIWASVLHAVSGIFSIPVVVATLFVVIRGTYARE